MSTEMIWQTICIDSEKTEQLGELLGAKLKGGEVIELLADLGGGKTTLVRGLGKGLGINQKITSPTFTISREYAGRNGLKLIHFDFYRLTEAGVIAMQLSESIGPKSVLAIEWAEPVRDLLPAELIKIELRLHKDNIDQRNISITYPAAMQTVIDSIRNKWEES